MILEKPEQLTALYRQGYGIDTAQWPLERPTWAMMAAVLETVMPGDKQVPVELAEPGSGWLHYALVEPWHQVLDVLRAENHSEFFEEFYVAIQKAGLTQMPYLHLCSIAYHDALSAAEEIVNTCISYAYAQCRMKTAALAELESQKGNEIIGIHNCWRGDMAWIAENSPETKLLVTRYAEGDFRMTTLSQSGNRFFAPDPKLPLPEYWSKSKITQLNQMYNLRNGGFLFVNKDLRQAGFTTFEAAITVGKKLLKDAKGQQLWNAASEQNIPLNLAS